MTLTIPHPRTGHRFTVAGMAAAVALVASIAVGAYQLSGGGDSGSSTSWIGSAEFVVTGPQNADLAPTWVEFAPSGTSQAASTDYVVTGPQNAGLAPTWVEFAPSGTSRASRGGNDPTVIGPHNADLAPAPFDQIGRTGPEYSVSGPHNADLAPTWVELAPSWSN